MMSEQLVRFVVSAIMLFLVAALVVLIADGSNGLGHRRVDFSIVNRTDHRLLDSRIYFEDGETAASFGEILSGTGSGRYSSPKETKLPEKVWSVWRSPGVGDIRNEIQVPRIPAGLLQDYNDADIVLIVLSDNNVLAQWRLTDSPPFGSPPRLVKDPVYWPPYQRIWAFRLR